MGVISICLVSLKGEIGCVVKNSLVSWDWSGSESLME